MRSIMGENKLNSLMVLQMFKDVTDDIVQETYSNCFWHNKWHHPHLIQQTDLSKNVKVENVGLESLPLVIV